MKKLIIWVFLLACLTVTSVNAQVFLIERGASSFTYPNIKAAVDALQDGDKLYLPPGIFSLTGYKWTGVTGTQNYSNTIAITKRVAIYGAGYNQGANSTIIQDGNFIFSVNASGSSITGVRFDSYVNLEKASNVMIARCKLTNTFSMTDVSSNNYINECEFHASVQMSQESGAVFTKSILYYPNNIFYNSSMINNIFVNNRVTNSAYTVSGTNNSFNYNLWVGTILQYNATHNNTFANEITEVAFEDTFQDFNVGNYHLKATSVGKNAANDGRDVGIFGTAFPFKESRLPSTPYFSIKAISAETDASGNLPVNLKIEAQER